MNSLRLIKSNHLPKRYIVNIEVVNYLLIIFFTFKENPKIYQITKS